MGMIYKAFQARQQVKTGRVGPAICEDARTAFCLGVARKAGPLPLGTFDRHLGKLSGFEEL